MNRMSLKLVMRAALESISIAIRIQTGVLCVVSSATTTCNTKRVSNVENIISPVILRITKFQKGDLKNVEKPLATPGAV